MTCLFKIMNNNFINQKMIDTGRLSFSSEDSLKVFGNVFDDCRSTVWRPKGVFHITEKNRKYYIESNIINSTLGNRTVAQILADHSPFPSQVSLDYDNNLKKFFFTSSGGSGADIKFSNQINAIWKTLGFMRETDAVVTVASPVYAEVSVFHDFEDITLDLQVPTSVGFVAGIFTINKDINISSSAKIYLKGNHVANNWDNADFSIQCNVDSRGFYASAEEQYYRHWRLEINDAQNHAGFIEISNLYIGESTNFHAVSSGISRSVVDNSLQTQSENGSKFFVKKTKYEVFSSLSLDNLDNTERLKLMDVYNDVGLYKPFFVSFDPSLSFSKEYSDYTRLVRFSKDINYQHLFLDYYTPSFEVEEVI